MPRRADWIITEEDDGSFSVSMGGVPRTTNLVSEQAALRFIHRFSDSPVVRRVYVREADGLLRRLPDRPARGR
jgi:hypothetical protein